METSNEKDQIEFMGFMNLYDVFMNASMCRSMMWKFPIEQTVELYTASDHGRSERMWIMSLYVLVEAWQAPAMAEARAYVLSRTSTDAIQIVIERGKNDGSLEKMRNVRNYMCHRDRREYWDSGRTDVAGQLSYHEELHNSFSQLFLAVSASERICK